MKRPKSRIKRTSTHRLENDGHWRYARLRIDLYAPTKVHSLSGASRIVGNDESAVVQQLSEYVLTTSFFDCTTCKSGLHNSYSVNDQSSKVQ